MLCVCGTDMYASVKLKEAEITRQTQGTNKNNKKMPDILENKSA